VKGEAVIIQPNGGVSKVELTVPTLKQLQEWVGGYIERVPGFEAYDAERQKLSRQDILSK
jgi:hypothetical protein